jgi:uncharacterized protein (TIGR02996 family)
MREAFEQAIRDDPDDTASYAAYADWLQEQTNPIDVARGEFMHVQMALEDVHRPTTERATLQARERELLAQYERVWLGELAPHLLDPILNAQGQPFEYQTHHDHRWHRGFLGSVHVRYLTTRSAQCLATAPVAQFLRKLHVDGECSYFFDGQPQEQLPPRVPMPEGVDPWELLELIDAPCLRNVRFFQMGDVDGEPPEDSWSDCHTDASGLEYVVAGMEHLEELHLLCKQYDIERVFALPNLRNLRILRVYHLGRGGTWRTDSDGYDESGREEYPYPLNILAANPAVGNLTHLLFHPHYSQGYDYDFNPPRRLSFLPIEQVRALVESPHLRSLTHLQLRLSDIGDAGVRLLIDSGILRQLKSLDLRHGCITDEGARLLAERSHLENLERLDLSRNAVTAAGLDCIRRNAPGHLTLRADNPLTPQELAERAFLNEGDFE